MWEGEENEVGGGGSIGGGDCRNNGIEWNGMLAAEAHQEIRKKLVMAIATQKVVL